MNYKIPRGSIRREDMWREEFFDFDNEGLWDGEYCNLIVHCKSSEVPVIKKALMESQARHYGDGLNENVRNQASPAEGEMTREQEMMEEMKNMARSVNELREALVEKVKNLEKRLCKLEDLEEGLKATGVAHKGTPKVKNLEERLCMLEDLAKGLEVTEVADKSTPIGHAGEEDNGKSRRRSRRQKAAAAQAARDGHRDEEEI